jgi:lipopolysaccharide transport system ATP-binding protein
MEKIIEVNKLSKVYRVSHQLMRNSNPTLRDDMRRMAKKPLALLGAYHGVEREKFWALKNLSLSVEPGEVVGIMGRNGSGKSTLFKILSQITYPSSGDAIIRGRLGSLLEVGTGFHPELTGRENIYFNGSVLGMKKREIDKKFDEIVAFSEVEKFLDTPVKYYSSGMKVRLAFSVASHIEPEVLLIDEVLAVGDVKFKQKSLEKMKQVAKDGTTILFVSHIVSQIEKICTRGIVLHDGVKKFDGVLEDAIDTYLELNSVSQDTDSEDQSVIVIGSFKMENVGVSMHEKHDFPGLSISMELANPRHDADELVVGAVIYDEQGRNLTSIHNQFINKPIVMSRDIKKIPITINIKQLNLMPDRYNVRLAVRAAGDREKIYHRIEKAASFKVPEYSFNSIKIEHRPGSAPPVVFDYDYEIG